ncbi:hypothetical protein H9N25_10785 [Pedobacter riviphilus]|uniref:Uncharacterized protein n=1 Tax=Pedobacter riviphilus TaxID=2766984 RepID=A0ABX6TQ40_9SPHI|nr:hypothetical protein [Pedobacter riviphilus]QNR86829.1 hypothetical protein H9N25_10785 [Pedobacter riviphilus]
MQKIRVGTVIFIGSVLLQINVNGQVKDDVQTTSGVEIPIQNSASRIKKTKPQQVSDQIIPDDRSLMAVKLSDAAVKFTTTNTPEVALSASLLTVEVSTKAGLITYSVTKGKVLLAQTKTERLSLIHKVFNGEPSYRVFQPFDAQKNETPYGLGQHQQEVAHLRS